MAFTRGSNPIWFEVDLTANAFDDTYYLFVLENTIPYIPAVVWHDPDGAIPWTSPIQFLANGTLPNDIYYDPQQVYRLEFRQGNTQQDPLIYLVENYVPGSGSGSSSGTVIPTANQITNPQFVLTNFESPYSETGATTQDIELAPGWILSLLGSGDFEFEKIALYADPALTTPTNAPYALRLLLNGSWTSAILKQRFNQIGNLWANKNVSTSITTRIEAGSTSISAELVNSAGTTLGVVLGPQTITGTFEEYTGNALLPDATNTDVPPDAWVEYQLILPVSISPLDIYVTSFQLTVSNDVDPYQFNYIQDSAERQIDDTFHYYKDSLLMQPKASILTGWDFGLNPWQFTTTAQTAAAFNTYYSDQTLVIQQNIVNTGVGNNISCGRTSYELNYAFAVQAITANNQFAIIQYIDPASARPYWENKLSSLVKLFVSKQTTLSSLPIKMKLFYSSTIPTSTTTNYPIVTWSPLGEPVFASGFTTIKPLNDPTYYLTAGNNVLTFDGFQLPAAASDNMTLGIVFYTLNNMIESGIIPDYIAFRSISLVPNDFSIETNSLSFDETLRRCQYYYESSYFPAQLPGTATNRGCITQNMATYFASGGAASFINSGFTTYYNLKREVPTMLYYAIDGTPNALTAFLQTNTFPTASATISISAWNQSPSVHQNQLTINSGGTLGLNPVSNGAYGCSYLLYHFTSNAVIGR